MFKTQHVVVGRPGLRASSNLRAQFEGKQEELMASCQGWWLGRIVAVVDHQGEHQPPSHAQLMYEEARQTAVKRARRTGAGRGGGAAGGGEAGAARASTTATAAVVGDGTEAGPRVHQVKVEWLGQIDVTSHKLSCWKDEPIVSLGVCDVVKRDCILYEEASPGVIRFNKNLALNKASLGKIEAAIPRQYLTSPSQQGHQALEGPTPATNTTYNHAGVAIKPNEGPRDADERAMWEAAVEEVRGFEWTGPKTAEDPEPPTHRVADIRRADGKMFAVVTTSHGDVQYDHALADVRKRMFRTRVVKSVKSLPYMMQWRNLEGSGLTLDLACILENALMYHDIMG